MSDSNHQQQQHPGANNPNNDKVRVQDNRTGVSVQLSEFATHKSGLLGTAERNGFVVTDAIRETDTVKINGKIGVSVATALREGYLTRDASGRIVENSADYVPQHFKEGAEGSGFEMGDRARAYAAEQLQVPESEAGAALGQMISWAQRTAPPEVLAKLERQLRTEDGWKSALDTIASEFFADQRNTQMQVGLSTEGTKFMADAFNALQAGGRDGTQTLFAVMDGTLDANTAAKVAESLGYKSADEFSGAVAEQIAEYDSILDERLAKPAGVDMASVISWAEAGNVSSQEHRAALLLMVQQGRLDGFAKILAKYQKANGGRSGDVKLPQGAEIKRKADGRETVQIPGLPEMTTATAKRLGYIS
jgi:hypothetical protein